MKKIYSLLLLVVSCASFGQTIYSENFGTTAPSASPYPLVTVYAGFQNTAPITYTGTSSVRSSGTLSTGYNGASAGSHVFISVTTGVGQVFQIDGINTSAYNSADLQLSFGYLKSSAASVALVVEKSTDGTNWSPITFTDNTNGSWNLVTVAGGQIPSSTTLSLRLTNPSTATTNAPQFRVDDIKISNVNASCTLTLGAATTVCDVFTTGIDTYTTTIPYTGGGSGSYTITPSAGAVSGDNPGTAATGNIIITGVNEGTNLVVNIVSGVCSYQANANSPECKATNTLPYSESFAYTVGSALGTSQMWSSFNTGDDVAAVAGSLNYSGVTSTGNSVLLSGAGKECTSPFTSTTAGTLYAAFLLNVSDLALMVDGNAGYFAGLCGTGSADYKGRVFVKRIGTQYSIGFDIAGSTTNVETTLRNVGDIVYVVIGYDFDTNSLGLWLNPTAGAAPTLFVNPTTPLTALGWFTLRQDSDANTPTVQVDELRIVTSLTDLGLTLGVSQNSIKGLKVYPNPVSNGTLFIETTTNATKNIVIYDVLGKQVLNATAVDNAINVSSLKAGVYVVKITEEGKTATRKLVVK